MNFGGHAEAGWLLAHAGKFSAPERRIITLLAVLPDLDGLVFFSAGWNEFVHRTFGHNIWVFLAAPLVALLFLTRNRRLAMLPIFYASIGLHFVLDLFVTGWWELRLFFPLHGGNITMARVLESVAPWDWEWLMKYPMQIGLLIVLTAAMILIYVRHRRTPLEVISPRFDSLIVNFLSLPWRERCRYCGSHAFYRCSQCGAALCPRHRTITPRLRVLCSPQCDCTAAHSRV